MIKELTLRGTKATVLWGYRTAATMKSWTIARDEEDNQWTLTAQCDRVDAFTIRQGPLLFTAPRQGGFWCWSVKRGTVQVAPPHLLAKLGPPEQ